MANAQSLTTPAAKHCAGCAFYSKPGYWSANCLAGSPEWAYKDTTGVRADNTCARWTAAAERLAA